MLNRTFRWKSEFLQAVYEENQERIEKMLIAGADVNEKEYVNLTLYTPMHLAAMAGDVVTMELLNRYGASINTKQQTTTPLMYAVENDYPIAVRWLLEHGARINDLDEYNRTALERAIDKKLEYCASLLIESGATPSKVNSNVTSSKPFEYEWDCIRCKRLPMWMERALLVRNMSLEDDPFADKEWAETIKEAVIKKDFPTLRELSSRRKVGKSWLEQRLWQNKTPLLYAIENKDSELTRLLLSLGAQIMESYHEQDNPLAKAFESEDELIILEMMEALATDLALKQNMISWNFGMGEWDYMWEGEPFFLYQLGARDVKVLQSKEKGENQVIEINILAGMGNIDVELEKYINSFRRILTPLGCYLWSNHYMYDNWLFPHLLEITKLTIYKSKDKMTAFEHMCWDEENLQNYLEVLREWDRKYQVIFEALELEYCILSFVKQPEDKEAFWKEVTHYFPKTDDLDSDDLESRKRQFMMLGRVELLLL